MVFLLRREVRRGAVRRRSRLRALGTDLAVPNSADSSVLTLRVKTSRRTELVNITDPVSHLVAASGVSSGVCHLYVPHTTAAVTINEGADPDVARDIEMALDRMAPRKGGYKHFEQNSDAHVKSSLVGVSCSVFIEGGRLRLGRWQAIFFCEFDGPRNREVQLKIQADPPPGSQSRP